MKKCDLGILIVDDEPIVRESLTKWFREDGFRVEAVADGAGALKKLQQESWNLVLVDIRMPGMDGLELLHRIKKLNSATVVIIITAFATVETAVRSLKEGAHDYITKPIDPDYLNHLVINALEQQLLTLENQRLREAVADLTAGSEIVGECPEMRRVLELVQTFARSEASVLVTGEMGTGKELVARSIHQAGARRYAPVVTVNCGALSETLQAAELFGYGPEHFPSGAEPRRGKLEMAVGGTLFLDEVGALDRAVQADLLRALETGEATAQAGVGGQAAPGFRVICASSSDLEPAVREQRFLPELYYKIAVCTISLPPLRARRGDIAKLSHSFLLRYARAMNRRTNGFTPDAMLALKAYDWPGNVRELQNVIERALVLSTGTMIEREHLLLQNDVVKTSGGKRLEDVEQRHIEQILRETGWNISRSATILDIDRVTLYHKIERYGLKRQV